MSSDVDICNLALAYLGDEATVSSINPPEGSPQASHCARFYPMALLQILEIHPWGFATTRATLALQSVNPSTTWSYAYAAPSGVLNYLDILDPNAGDDYSSGVVMGYPTWGPNNVNLGVYTPQPFVVETDANGNDLILTNQQNAVLRYTQALSDASRFSPLATEALARLVASKLAGPLLKGDTGRAEAGAQLQLFMKALEKATESDSNQRRVHIAPGAQWMVNR